jgi:hypothetical protein
MTRPCLYCDAPDRAPGGWPLCPTCREGFALHRAVCRPTNAVEHERYMLACGWIKWRWLETEAWEWVIPGCFVAWCLGPYKDEPGLTMPQWGATPERSDS